MKNKIFALIMTIFLLLPFSVWAEEGIVPPAEEEPAIESVAETQQLDEDAEGATEEQAEVIAEPEINNSAVLPHKQPISKRKIIKKFLLAMFGVVVSSLILYIGLSVYNRIRNGIVNKVYTPEGETPLNTPDDLEGAVKTFLDKTEWK